MSFLDSVKRFFGIQSSGSNTFSHDEIPRIFAEDGDDNNENFGFNVFSSPVEMQRYFENEMENLMRSFGIPNNFFGNFNSFHNQLPESENYSENEHQSLRDRYLKPGFQENKSSSNHEDTDIDGQVDLGDVQSILQNDNNKTTPNITKPNVQFYGQQVSTTKIRKPDGSLETRRTICNNDGSKETTVTHKLGNKEYTVTTRVDKNGQEEVIENLVNMEENEAKALIKKDNQIWQEDPNWSLFYKFFK